MISRNISEPIVMISNAWPDDASEFALRKASKWFSVSSTWLSTARI